MTNITNMARTITPNLSASQQMGNPTAGESLEKLRSDLRHFEECGELGETVMEIKSHLLRRIAEIEAAPGRIKVLEPAALPAPLKTPDLR